MIPKPVEQRYKPKPPPPKKPVDLGLLEAKRYYTEMIALRANWLKSERYL